MRVKRAARNVPGGFLIIAFFLFVSGCATPQTDRLMATAEAFPEPVELTNVPFFPQEDYQCGPAALATVLTWSGVNVTPEQLTPQVYIPDRQGSLQPELLAATRRYGRVPYVLQPEIESLAAEVASGNPVLVLQNLALSFYTDWHYAVVVGFDLRSGEIVLRSGREKRHVVPLETFERTWGRGEFWAMVALPPDRLPFTAEELPYVDTIAAFERMNANDVAAKGYLTALKRWPRSLIALIGLGNVRYAAHDLSGAELAFRRATQFHPQSAVAQNNLAQTLADRGRYDEAERFAQHAVELGASDPMLASYQKTLDDIVKARAAQQQDNDDNDDEENK